MKKLNVIIAIVAIIFVALGACKKDKEIMQTTEKEDFTAQKILKFKSKIENPEITKSNQTMSIDSAVWYIEALLNYSYCITYQDMPEVDYMQIDSTCITFNNTSEIDYAKISEIYNNLLAWFEQTKTKYKTADIFFTIADVYIEENLIKVKTLIEYSITEETKSILTYTINGDWKWGNKLGNCSGQYIGKRDASTEINRYLQSVLTPYPYGENSYFTDITQLNISGAWVEPNYQDLLWWDVFPIDYDYCMPEEEIRFWAEKSIIAQQKARTDLDSYFAGNNKEFQKVIFSSDIIIYNNAQWCYHRLIPYYGVKHTSPINGEL